MRGLWWFPGFCACGIVHMVLRSIWRIGFVCNALHVVLRIYLTSPRLQVYRWKLLRKSESAQEARTQMARKSFKTPIQTLNPPSRLSASTDQCRTSAPDIFVRCFTGTPRSAEIAIYRTQNPIAALPAVEESKTWTPAGPEFDLHVWVKPETDNMVRTYTVSIGKRSVCIDQPLDDAIDWISNTMEDWDTGEDEAEDEGEQARRTR